MTAGRRVVELIGGRRTGGGAGGSVALGPTPAWDQEGTLAQARAQVRHRVEAQAAGRGDATIIWLGAGGPAADTDAISGSGTGVVVASDLRLWRWPEASLPRLSAVLRERDGLLVFIEPTAGLGWRRALQLAGKRYRRDLPAELRAAGFTVTTQVRLWNGPYGTYVRGEARHFD